MFGPDTALVIDAIQIAGLALAAGAGGAWLVFRRRIARNTRAIEHGRAGSLEDRVRVLERIATDRSQELADEIEGLRDLRQETN